MSIAQRLKDARARLGLSQKEVAAQSGVSSRGYQGYEDGRSVPGGDAIAGLVRLGINANWLLTGEGPMLRADLATPAQVAAEPPPPTAKPPATPRINVDALAHAYAVTLQTAPKGETLAQSAKKAVAFYQFCFDQGLITEDGEATET